MFDLMPTAIFATILNAFSVKISQRVQSVLSVEDQMAIQPATTYHAHVTQVGHAQMHQMIRYVHLRRLASMELNSIA